MRNAFVRCLLLSLVVLGCGCSGGSPASNTPVQAGPADRAAAQRELLQEVRPLYQLAAEIHKDKLWTRWPQDLDRPVEQAPAKIDRLEQKFSNSGARAEAPPLCQLLRGYFDTLKSLRAAREISPDDAAMLEASLENVFGVLQQNVEKLEKEAR